MTKNWLKAEEDSKKNISNKWRIPRMNILKSNTRKLWLKPQWFTITKYLIVLQLRRHFSIRVHYRYKRADDCRLSCFRNPHRHVRNVAKSRLKTSLKIPKWQISKEIAPTVLFRVFFCDASAYIPTKLGIVWRRKPTLSVYFPTYSTSEYTGK